MDFRLPRAPAVEHYKLIHAKRSHNDLVVVDIGKGSADIAGGAFADCQQQRGLFDTTPLLFS